MKIISYADYIDSKLETQIDFLNKINVNNFIIRSYENKNVYNLLEEDIKNINEQLKLNKINIFSLDPLIKEEDYFNEESLSNYLKTIEIAKKLKSESIILRLPNINDIIMEIDTIKIHLDEILKEAKNNKIKVLIKQNNVKNNVLVYILKRYSDKYLNVIFSPKHAILNNDSAISGYRILKNYSNTLLAADIDSKNNPELLGYGRVNILDLFKRMRRDNFKGNIILDNSFINFFNEEEQKKVPFIKKLFKMKSEFEKYLKGYSLRIFNEVESKLVNIYDIYINQINVLRIVFN